MRLFSEKVSPTLTDSPLNIIKVQDFSEIFFGVYEVEINKNKYPVEKISEHNGDPVVSIPVEMGGKIANYPFVLTKGKFEVVFNEHSDYVDIFESKLEDFSEEEPDVIIEKNEIFIPEVIEDRKNEILLQIQEAKKNALIAAKKELEIRKSRQIKQIREESNTKKKALESYLESARENLVDEFTIISQRIKKEVFDSNDEKYLEIRETIDNKIEEIRDSLDESLKKDFSKSSQLIDKSIKQLVKDLYENNINPKVDKELHDIAVEIHEKVSEIDNNLNSKLKEKADLSLLEGVDKELSAIRDANIELNNSLNKGVQKALSRVGNVDKKVIQISEEFERKLDEKEQEVVSYFDEKLELVKEETLDITDEARKYFQNLIQESRNNLLTEIRKIKAEKPVEYVLETKKSGKVVKDWDSIEKEWNTKIHDKIENVKTDLRKYVAVYASGGGTNATQYQDGGTMNGDLTVVGTISASQYLGIPYPSENDTLDIVTSRGNITNNSIKVNNLSANSVNLTSVIEASAFITNGGTSSEFVKGDGSLDNTSYVKTTDMASTLILYATSAASDIGGYSRLVTSNLDPDYDDTAVNIPTGPITGTDQLIASLILDAGVIVGDVGIFATTTIGNVKKVAGSGSAGGSFHFHIYKRDSDGTEEFITASDPTSTVTSDFYSEFSSSAIFNNGVFADTDRLVLKFYGSKVGGGSSASFEFQFGGETPVRTLLPVPVSVLLSDYVPYTGATDNVDLGSRSLSSSKVSVNAGTVIEPSYNFTSDDNSGMWSPASDTLAWSTNGVERMRINANGNVGIGITSPRSKIDIVGNLTPNSHRFSQNSFVLDDTEGLMQFIAADSASYAGGLVFTSAPTSGNNKHWGLFAGGPSVSNNFSIRYATTSNNTTVNVFNDTELFTILKTGNVGVGTATPNEKLTVAGNTFVTGGLGIGATNTAAGTIQLGSNGSNGAPSIGWETTGFYKTAGNSVVFTSSGANATTFTAGGGISTLGNVAGGSGTVNAPSHTFTAESSLGMWRAGTNILAFSTASSERMRIDANGNVGVGTTTPNEKLTVSGNISATNIYSGNIVYNTGDQSIAGDKTFTDDLICNGQITAPNQTSSTSDSVITKSLGDLLYTQAFGGWSIHIDQNTGWTPSLLGSGTAAAFGGNILACNTSTVSGNRAAIYAGGYAPYTYCPPGGTHANNSNSGVYFDRKLVFGFRITHNYGSNQGIAANAEGYLRFGGNRGDTTFGPLTEAGIGVFISNRFLYGMVHNGTSLNQTTLPIYNMAGWPYPVNYIEIYSDGLGNVSFFNNRTLIQTISGGPTSRTGTAGTGTYFGARTNENLNLSLFIPQGLTLTYL